MLKYKRKNDNVYFISYCEDMIWKYLIYILLYIYWLFLLLCVFLMIVFRLWFVGIGNDFLKLKLEVLDILINLVFGL